MIDYLRLKEFGTIYFYFDKDLKNVQSAKHVAACLLKQLISEINRPFSVSTNARPSVSGSYLPQDVLSMYEHTHDISLSRLVDLIKVWSKVWSDKFGSSVFIFLDGLDQLVERELDPTLDLVRQLCLSMKVFLTTQRCRMNSVGKSCGVRRLAFRFMQEHPILDDLNDYIMQELEEKPMTDDVRQAIRYRLLEAAEGR